MTMPEIVSSERWLAARTELLAREKELTRARDALNADRRRLPMVKVEKAYELEGPAGHVGLRDLFGDARQLVVQHFMYDPSWDAGCPSCSAGLDEMSTGLLDHLAARETAFAVVARAPFAALDAYRKSDRCLDCGRCSRLHQHPSPSGEPARHGRLPVDRLLAVHVDRG